MGISVMRFPASCNWRMISVSNANPSLFCSNGISLSAAVRPVPRMPLGGIEAGDTVLEFGQDAIAHQLVQRHPPFTRSSFFQHSRAEDRVGFLAFEWRHDVGEHLRGILTVAVQQHDDVEVVRDGPLIPGLLVTAVAEVARMTYHFERQGRLQLLISETDKMGCI